LVRERERERFRQEVDALREDLRDLKELKEAASSGSSMAAKRDDKDGPRRRRIRGVISLRRILKAWELRRRHSGFVRWCKVIMVP
ncbi:unnamed protein product, partial [Discosporangium mesarthrocarpum]